MAACHSAWSADPIRSDYQGTPGKGRSFASLPPYPHPRPLSHWPRRACASGPGRGEISKVVRGILAYPRLTINVQGVPGPDDAANGWDRSWQLPNRCGFVRLSATEVWYATE